MKSTPNELRRRWALARGWEAVEHSLRGTDVSPRVYWRPPGWTEGRALEEREIPFNPGDMNSVLAECREMDSALRLRFVHRLAAYIDQKYGGEVDPTDVMNPAEITALILGLEPEEMAEALVEALENKEHAE